METFCTNGMAYGPTTSITVGASPFAWANPEQVPVTVIMGTVGAVTQIQLSSPIDGVLVDAGLAGGQFMLNPGWRIRVTYVTTPPTMSYAPF